MVLYVCCIFIGLFVYWLSLRSKLSRCSSLLMFAYANFIVLNGMMILVGVVNVVDLEEFLVIVFNCVYIVDFVLVM